MDGFAGYKTAATEVLPDAVTVMDPFHVVALAGAKLDLTRQRIQQQTLGRRGHTGDPLYGIRRIARTRLHAALQPPIHPADQCVRRRRAPRRAGDLELIYQKIIAAYADPNRRRGKKAMTAIIDSIRARRARRTRGDRPTRPHPVRAAATTSWPSSTTTPPTDPPKPSTDAWKPCAATPSDSETSPTTAGAHYCTAAHSTHSSMHSELRRAGLIQRPKGQNGKSSEPNAGSEPFRCLET